MVARPAGHAPREVPPCVCPTIILRTLSREPHLHQVDLLAAEEVHLDWSPDGAGVTRGFPPPGDKEQGKVCNWAWNNPSKPLPSGSIGLPARLSAGFHGTGDPNPMGLADTRAQGRARKQGNGMMVVVADGDPCTLATRQRPAHVALATINFLAHDSVSRPWTQPFCDLIPGRLPRWLGSALGTSTPCLGLGCMPGQAPEHTGADWHTDSLEVAPVPPGPHSSAGPQTWAPAHRAP